MNKKLKLLSLVIFLGIGYFFLKDKHNTLPVNAAAGTRPTNIDARDMNDAQLSTFYNGVSGKKGDELVAFLHDKTKDHLEYNYESNSDREIYKIIDRDWTMDELSPANLDNFDYSGDNGYLRLLYGDYNGDPETAMRFYKADAPTHVTFDKEHIWPQSLGDFGRTGGAGSDFHALWAADPKINQNAHNNNHYAVPLLNIKDRDTSYGATGGRTGKLTANGPTVFEPYDEYKGDIARAMFYMPARYYEFVDKLHPKLELVNGLPDPVVGSAFLTGKAGDLETLLEWNELDPVDEFEIHRNNLIFNNYQKNRNPFIDYPQWARIAYDPSYSGSGASNASQTSSVGTNSDPFKDAELLSISLDTTNVKVDYLKNEKFRSQGLVVTAYYDNGESRKAKNYTLDFANNSVLSTPGSKVITVTLTHGEQTKTATFTIIVGSESLSDFLFISEVYGGGGNSGASHTHDFIEIYNHSSSPISLVGKSIQQAAQISETWNTFTLSGEIDAKSYYLLKLSGTNNPGMIETPQGDISGGTNLAEGSFKIALVNTTSKFDTSSVSNNSEVIDFVGAGRTVNDFYFKKATSPNVTQSLTRKFAGGVPSNERDNSKDYILANPSPANSAISVAINIMSVGNTINQCYDQYPIFKEKVLKLTPSVYDQDTNALISHGQRYYFETGNDARLIEGRARYLAWATHLGDLNPYLADEEILEPSNELLNNNSPAIYLLLTSIFITFSAYFVIKKTQQKS